MHYSCYYGTGFWKKIFIHTPLGKKRKTDDRLDVSTFCWRKSWGFYLITTVIFRTLQRYWFDVTYTVIIIMTKEITGLLLSFWNSRWVLNKVTSIKNIIHVVVFVKEREGKGAIKYFFVRSYHFLKLNKGFNILYFHINTVSISSIRPFSLFSVSLLFLHFNG